MHKRTTTTRNQQLNQIGLPGMDPLKQGRFTRRIEEAEASVQPWSQSPSPPASASEKQLAFINDLLRVVHTPEAEQVRKAMGKGLSRDQASRCIEGLLEQRKQLPTEWVPSNSGAEPEAGMYRLADGTIVRVYLGQKSGRMLAKRLVSEGEHHSYEYMGAASRFVDENTAKLTLAEAKEFGRMTGHCCVCARRLDVPESVEAGIGPVCASRLEA